MVNDSDVEFWYTRDLQKVLDYDRWGNFENVINKAKISCETAGMDCLDKMLKNQV